MKLIRLIPILLLALVSCDAHLDEKIYKSKDITVKWYKLSTISTVHDYIDMERWGYTNNIMNANTDGIYDIKLIGDTIIIKTLPKLIVYDLVARKNGCYIKLDTTVTLYDYMKKFQPENAKYYVKSKTQANK